jgi:hypothetical protein
MASLPENIKALREEYETAQRTTPDPIEWLEDEQAITSKAPHLRLENIKGWKGTWRPKAGWGEVMDAIDSVGEELKRMGVEMSFGK